MVLNKFKDVLEHDMDMLFLEEFASSQDFCDIFLSKINLQNAILICTWQSKTDYKYGESDITIVFESRGKKIALLIEDKINAIAMPEQPYRYELRGKKGIKEGEYEEYYTFIVAPYEYLNNNQKAKEYPYKVSYEEIKEYFINIGDARSKFKLSLIDFAIAKQKKGYQAIKNDIITDFWQKYVSYQSLNFPRLKLVVSNDIKPTNSIWTYFQTNIPKMPIMYKSNKGYVDLTFKGQVMNIEAIKSFVVQAVGDYYSQGLTIVPTGKSCSIRIEVPIVDFLKSFDEQEIFIKQSFLAVEKLYDLSNKLDLAGITKLFN